MQRTVSLTLPRYQELLSTVSLYNKITNAHISAAVELKTASKFKLHKSLYSKIRQKYPHFPSALIQCARDNAVEMLKAVRNVKNAKRPEKRSGSSIRFDLRTAKVFLRSGEIQITTIKGRKKYAVKIPDYFSKYFHWKVKALTLGVDKSSLKLKVIVEGDKPLRNNGTVSKDVLGIDLGLKNFAVLSNGTFIKSNTIRGVKRKYAYLRRKLQSKGTASARQKLTTISGAERRFVKDYNHCVSKQIAQMPYGSFAIEDLNGIGKQNKGRIFNRMVHGWSYYEFRQFLTYKAEERGKSVIAVEPRRTSQKCSSCGFIASKNRNKGVFRCLNCGFRCSADLNASINISSTGAILLRQGAVNHPDVTMNDVNGSLHNHRDRHQLQAPSSLIP